MLIRGLTSLHLPAWMEHGSVQLTSPLKRQKHLHGSSRTVVIWECSLNQGSLYNIEHSNGGLITFPGGIPIKAEDGKTIGAIGVSGSTVENDHTVATAGAEAVKHRSIKKEKEVLNN